MLRPIVVPVERAERTAATFGEEQRHLYADAKHRLEHDRSPMAKTNDPRAALPHMPPYVIFQVGETATIAVTYHFMEREQVVWIVAVDEVLGEID